MGFANSNYELQRMSNSYNLNNYREMYKGVSSGEKIYMNCIKYTPNTTHTGNYIKSN